MSMNSSANSAAGAPFGAFGFKVTVSNEAGVTIGYFQEASGLSVSVGTTAVKEGGVNDYTHQIIERASHANIVLKRGLVDGTLFDWLDQVVHPTGEIHRATLTINILGDDLKNVMTYVCRNALPIKWDGPSLNVMQDAIATESLELIHDGLKRVG